MCQPTKPELAKVPSWVGAERRLAKKRGSISSVKLGTPLPPSPLPLSPTKKLATVPSLPRKTLPPVTTPTAKRHRLRKQGTPIKFPAELSIARPGFQLRHGPSKESAAQRVVSRAKASAEGVQNTAHDAMRVAEKTKWEEKAREREAKAAEERAREEATRKAEEERAREEEARQVRVAAAR